MKKIILVTTFFVLSCKHGTTSKEVSELNDTYSPNQFSDILDPKVEIINGMKSNLSSTTIQNFKSAIEAVFSNDAYKGRIFFPKYCSVSLGYLENDSSSMKEVFGSPPTNRYLFVSSKNEIATDGGVPYPNGAYNGYRVGNAVTGNASIGPTSTIYFPTRTEFKDLDGRVVLFKSFAGDARDEASATYIVLGVTASGDKMIGTTNNPQLSFIPIQYIAQNTEDINFGRNAKSKPPIKLIEIQSKSDPKKIYGCK